MKKTKIIFVVAAAAALATACRRPTAGTTPPKDVDANPTAPTTAALFAIDKRANHAWQNGDAKWFQDNLSTKFLMYTGGMRLDKEALVGMIASWECDMKSTSFTDPSMARVSDAIYLVTYQGAFDGVCGMGDNTIKQPPLVRAASVYTREGDGWSAVFHGENAIMGQKIASAGPSAADQSTVIRSEEPLQGAPANRHDKPIAEDQGGAQRSEVQTLDGDTEALISLHRSVLDASQSGDFARLDDLTTAELSLVDVKGGWHSGQRDVLEFWSAELECNGHAKMRFTDGQVSTISPTVKVLTGRGTCEGRGHADLYQTAFYVKKSGEWKLAFAFDSPPIPAL